MSSLNHYGLAIRTQVRVISALLLRETRVTYGSTSLGYFWAVAEPLFGTALLVLIFSAIAHVPPLGTSFALFFATGILLFQMWRKLAASLMNVFNANRGLLNYPLVKTTDVVYARTLLIILTNLIVCVLFFAGITLIAETSLPARLDDIILAFVATVLLGLAFGLNNAVIALLWPTWTQVEAIISRPMFFISGIFFLPSFFSPDIQYWLSWNPLLHCIDWFREGYYGYYESQVLDKGYLFMCIAVLLFTGFAGERLYRKKII